MSRSPCSGKATSMCKTFPSPELIDDVAQVVPRPGAVELARLDCRRPGRILPSVRSSRSFKPTTGAAALGRIPTRERLVLSASAAPLYSSNVCKVLYELRLHP